MKTLSKTARMFLIILVMLGVLALEASAARAPRHDRNTYIIPHPKLPMEYTVDREVTECGENNDLIAGHGHWGGRDPSLDCTNYTEVFYFDWK